MTSRFYSCILVDLLILCAQCLSLDHWYIPFSSLSHAFPTPSCHLFSLSSLPSSLSPCLSFPDEHYRLSLSVCFLVRQCVVCVGGGLGSCKQLQPSSRCEEGVPGPKWHTTRLHRRQERRLPALHCKRQYTRPHGRTMHAYS